ncbi:MAG: hypothetical protein GY703_07120, partial [Gammaproteobacteria bacterium]|nr:hypothetical protein [Gammaproteobacteria bacterium]
SLSAATGADELLLDSIEKQSDKRSAMVVPARGQSMSQVRRRLGDPEDKTPAIGDPPITRWIYEDLTVYFEYQHVITSVIHR